MTRHITTEPDDADPDVRRTDRRPSDIVVRLGREELILRQRYELVSILNDVFAGALFLIGSFLFFRESTTYAATWLFVIGSVSMLIRPTIRLVRRVHLGRIHPDNPGATHESSMDF